MDLSKLIEVVREYGVRWASAGREFTLASGAKSKFYIDFSRIVFVPYAANIITETLVDLLQRTCRPLDYNRVGGPMSGADPIIGGIMAQLCLPCLVTGEWVRGFVVRKEPKGRGPDEGSFIEGYLEAGDRAVLIEDVTTSGGSVLKAVAAVEGVGAKVVKVISLLDRQAGAREKLAGYNFESILTLDQLNLT
jgi:orotate phosphoribosyltransferase